MIQQAIAQLLDRRDLERDGARSVMGEIVRGEPEHAEDDEFVMTVGNARHLDQALQQATTELMCLLDEEYGRSHRASSALLGQCIRYDIGNVYDPAYTVVAKFEKALLSP